MKIINEKKFTGEPKTIKKIKGVLWGEGAEIQTDVPVYISEGDDCPHLGEKYIVRCSRYDGSYFDIIYANCPRVIVAYNDGRNCSTEVCADCIQDELNN